MIPLSDSNENNQYDSDDELASGGLDGIVLGKNEKATVRNGKIIVTKRVDKDLEMVYTYGERPRALKSLNQEKINDSISGNIPFKQNVWK